EEELELAGHAPTDRLGDGTDQLVRRQHALRAAHGVEADFEPDPERLRIGLQQQQIGAVRAQHAGKLLDRVRNGFGVHDQVMPRAGALCIWLSPKLGSATAWRLPSPPHTTGTIWSGRAVR